MKTTHLTEEEIQQYVLDETVASIAVIEHIHSCKQCKEKASAYQLLFSGLQQQPQASFDFNLEELVMFQLPLPAPKPVRENVLIYVFIAAAAAIVGFALYYFREYVTTLFENIASAFIYLVLTAFITISVFLIIDMYKSYKKKMHILDFNK